MLCSQSPTTMAISSVKKYFFDPNLFTKNNGLKSLQLSEGGDRYNVKQITNCK